MGKWIHVIDELDKETGTAVCRNCGPVEATYLKTKDSWRCPVGRKEQKGHWTKGVGWETTEARNARIAGQSSRCAICATAAPLVRDHCHQTNKDRAMLCQDCNLGLGRFKDNPEILEAAANYIRWHETPYE